MSLRDVILKWNGYEVSPMEVYTDVFKLGEGYIQKENEPSGQFKANPILYYREDGKEYGHYRILFEDTFEEVLKEAQECSGWSILNGITYFGRRNVQEHASKMYAMIFDLDGVTDETLNNFLNGAINGAVYNMYPIPNYVVLSGHGIHLYYVFEEPISLFPNLKLQLKELKYALTEKIWNMYTSTEKKKQFQGINQGFRVIGSKTKKDAAEPVVRAFRLNEHPFSLEKLCSFVQIKVDLEKRFEESKYTLEDAKKKFPKWYKKVILENDKNRNVWDIAGKVHGDDPYALYHWWLRKIHEGTVYGHRYFGVMCLAIYASKCGVEFEKLKQDSEALIPFMNEMKPDMPFTKEDVESALECYDLKYCTFPRSDIEKISGIQIEPNKRKGLTQKEHLEEARAIRDVRIKRKGKINWWEGNGRPIGSGTAEQKVMEWQKAHPNGIKADCIKDTGLSKKTVYKWWKK